MGAGAARVRGFTLVEITVAAFVLAVVVIGATSLTAVVQDQFYRMTLRQKAVFVLHGEMERIVAAFHRAGAELDPDGDFLTLDLPGDRELADEELVYPEFPRARAIPSRAGRLSLAAPVPAAGAQVTASPSAFNEVALAPGRAPQSMLFVDAGVPGVETDDAVVVWLDQARGLVAEVSYTFSATESPLPMGLPEGAGTNCFGAPGCRLLVTYVRFPFRLPDGVDLQGPTPVIGGLVDVWSRPETYSAATLVGRFR